MDNLDNNFNIFWREPLAKNQVVVAKMGGQKITKLGLLVISGNKFIKMPFIIPYYDKDYLYHC